MRAKERRTQFERWCLQWQEINDETAKYDFALLADDSPVFAVNTDGKLYIEWMTETGIIIWISLPK